MNDVQWRQTVPNNCVNSDPKERSFFQSGLAVRTRFGKKGRAGTALGRVMQSVLLNQLKLAHIHQA